jgi:predicted nucleic acid-binding protein
VIVVDTSVWIDAVLEALLDADEVALAWPVRLELLAGVSKRDRPALARGLAALPVLRPSEDTWDLIDRWTPAAADRGRRFGLSDWLIAALASEIGALVWSRDEDFAGLEQLNMARRYLP